MFSKEEKRKIADGIEKILLDLKHPEMPDKNPMFRIHIDGKESWSWAELEPNWTFKSGKPMGINPFNEVAREVFRNLKEQNNEHQRSN